MSDSATLQRPEWASAKHIAAIYGVSRSKLYELAAAGRIRTSSLRERGKKKGSRLFSCDSVAAYIEAHATGGESHPTETTKAAP